MYHKKNDGHIECCKYNLFMRMHVDIHSLQLKRKLSLQKNTEPSVEGNFLKILF